MLFVYIFLISFTFSLGSETHLTHEPLESDEIIKAINSAGSTWKAGRNFHPTLKKNYAKYLINDNIKSNHAENYSTSKRETVQDLPTEFDARDYWPNCKCISKVHDQGPCAASCAVATAAVLTDRYCIANEGYFTTPLSARNILSCYKKCGDCTGTYDLLNTWLNLVNDGVVTGGAYRSHQGCQPYSFPTCEHHVTGKRRNCYSYKNVNLPQCSTNCTNPKYQTPYDSDIHKAKSYFKIENDEAQTKTDLYMGGPLVATFSIYEDFVSYKSGVYQHLVGRQLGSACARILGWGVENGTNYWLAANSWNSDWGDGGLFKIIRGINECGFEGAVFGGIPDVHP